MSGKLPDKPAAEQGVSEAQRASLLANMDVTMRQKLAFISAHFQLHDGARILDIGCGSGKGSHDMAVINPRLHVTGLDYDQDYINKAQGQYEQQNLDFVQGDARALDDGIGMFDAILNSSLMHEVYSFNGYSERAVIDSLRSQLGRLNPGGVILIRDFMRPAQPDAMVYLDLPPNAHKDGDMSYPDRLLEYSRIANSENPESTRGFICEHVETLPDRWERFYLPQDWAYEFIWRKEYLTRFEREAHEKYGVWTARQYREIPEGMGARVVYQAPYYNPWIAKNWHEGKFRMFDAQMKPLQAPPSNYITLIQKVAEGEGLTLREHRSADMPPSYLRLSHYRNEESGAAYDLVSRDGGVTDVLPYRVKADGRVTVYAKSAYPRPLVNTHPRQMSPNIDGKMWSGHMVEPLAMANMQQGDVAEAVKVMLAERTHFAPTDVAAIVPALEYYTAPADVNERVASVFVELRDAAYESGLKGHFSGFSADGTVRAYDLQDMLRSVQVGMLPEARLELNMYGLMRHLNIVPEQWIGEDFTLATADMRYIRPGSAQRAAYTQTDKPAHYLRVLRSVFVEEARKGDKRVVTHARELEFAVPDYRGSKGVSSNSAMIVPLLRDAHSGEVMIGLQRRELPAVQAQEGASTLTTIPGLRLPSAVTDLDEVRNYIAGKTGTARSSIQRLGESYFPSMGIMPHRAYPYLVSDPALAARDDLAFVPLREVFAGIEGQRDAHLMVAVLRCVHALGLWDDYSRKPVPETAPAAGL